MKMILTRLTRLEERSMPSIDWASQQTADLLRERRRRRLEAAGLPFEDRQPRSALLNQGRLLSFAETLRLCRQERLLRLRDARKQT
jgi:hypothetical protein